MILDFSKVRIFVRTKPADFRKQINGLSVLVQEEIPADIFGNNLFLFCNKMRNRMKILYWDKNGFCQWLKRLEKDRFPWPKNEEEVREITLEQLKMLLSGIDFFNAHKKLNYKKVI
jgi:transposase